MTWSGKNIGHKSRSGNLIRHLVNFLKFDWFVMNKLHNKNALAALDQKPGNVDK